MKIALKIGKPGNSKNLISAKQTPIEGIVAPRFSCTEVSGWINCAIALWPRLGPGLTWVDLTWELVGFSPQADDLYKREL